MDFFFIKYVVLDSQHDKYGNQVGNKVIQTQSTRVVVEKEQHHQRRQVHDKLHVRHARLLLHLHGLPCGQCHVKENRNGSHNWKQTHVVTVKRNPPALG